MLLSITQFKGTAPSLSNEQLGEGYSAVSINARTGRGLLEAYHSSGWVTRLKGSAESFHQYENFWLSWEGAAYAVNAPLKNDPFDYVLIAEEGQDPKLTYNLLAGAGFGPYPASTRLLGVPTPATVSLGLAIPNPLWFVSELPDDGGLRPDHEITKDEYDNSSVTYVIVLVDAWGRLSAPSAPSAQADVKEWKFINTGDQPIILPTVAPTGFVEADATRGTSSSIRIYRANYSDTSALYQFVAEVPFGTPVYHDTLHSADLQESTVSDNWAPPPNTDTALYPNGTMEKVVIMGSDTLVGHNKKFVCFAEPDAMHAWPVEYYKVLQDEIVTIIPAGSALVVLTTGYPYVIQGSHPASMEATRLADPAPCSSKKGITEVRDAVYFTTDMGLYAVQGYKLVNMSQSFITDREWDALDPSTMVLANYDGKVLISCPTVGFTYMFDPANPSDALRKIDFSPTAFAQLDGTGDLVYKVGDTSVLNTFDDTDSSYFRLLKWESKTYQTNAAHAYNVLKVRANVYPVTITVENEKPDGSGVRSYTRTLQNENFSYLPETLGMSKEWRVKVEASSVFEDIKIRDIQLAQGAEELN